MSSNNSKKGGYDFATCCSNEAKHLPIILKSCDTITTIIIHVFINYPTNTNFIHTLHTHVQIQNYFIIVSTHSNSKLFLSKDN